MGGRTPKTTVDVGDGRADGDTGGGPVDPDTGLREWYDPEPETPGITWADIFERWALVEADLHQLYGIDLGQPGLLRERTGHWLRVRVIGLLSEPRTRLSRAFRARDEEHTSTARAADVSFDDYD
ncbi:hypothetical protein ACFFV7_50940 [Nonomuraea spiralis]|uniref:Uncharacterized protein n=1 Tax=Nonomuraea spiralis TaxID=46182 RepID=A0ABV5IYG5_9ACTN|nr:hypothetical protein [Nonomuraea spiralis]